MAGAGSAGAAGAASGGVSGSGDAGGGAGGGGGSAGSAGNGGAPSQALVISPSELVFGAVQQTQSPTQVVKLTSGAASVKLVSVKLDAAAQGTASFELVSPPADGTTIAAGQSLDVQVRFKPSGIALFESQLVIETKGPDLKSNVGLFGLGTKGLEGENEPYLKVVLDTLGYKVDVGGSALLSTTTPLVGSEVAAQRFQAAGAGDVRIIPVALLTPRTHPIRLLLRDRNRRRHHRGRPVPSSEPEDRRRQQNHLRRSRRPLRPLHHQQDSQDVQRRLEERCQPGQARRAHLSPERPRRRRHPQRLPRLLRRSRQRRLPGLRLHALQREARALSGTTSVADRVL